MPLYLGPVHKWIQQMRKIGDREVGRRGVGRRGEDLNGREDFTQIVAKMQEGRTWELGAMLRGPSILQVFRDQPSTSDDLSSWIPNRDYGYGFYKGMKLPLKKPS